MTRDHQQTSNELPIQVKRKSERQDIRVANKGETTSRLGRVDIKQRWVRLKKKTAEDRPAPMPSKVEP